MKTIKKNRNKSWGRSFAVLLVMLFPLMESQAQLNPMSSVYFHNQYLTNPAMAGLQQRVHMNAGVRQQFSTMPGLPLTQFVTVDYGFAEKTGIGLQVTNDKAGLLKRTRAAVSYAYHLPLNADSRHFSFGFSVSVADDDINLAALRGDDGDQDVYNVNLRKTYLDADFGVAYRTDRLQIQGAMTNMKRLLKKDNHDVADLPLFYSAISYRIPASFAVLEPKVVYRGVRGFRNLLDAGVNVEFNSPTVNKVNALVLYHSAKSLTLGIGINWNNRLAINTMYTTNTSPLQGYTSGDYELGISYSIFNK